MPCGSSPRSRTPVGLHRDGARASYFVVDGDSPRPEGAVSAVRGVSREETCPQWHVHGPFGEFAADDRVPGGVECDSARIYAAQVFGGEP